MSKGGKRPGAGRPKGAKNRVDEALRAQFEMFLIYATDDIKDLFDQIKSENPKQALDAIKDFAEFVLPKLARTENETKHDGKVTIDINKRVFNAAGKD